MENPSGQHHLGRRKWDLPHSHSIALPKTCPCFSSSHCSAPTARFKHHLSNSRPSCCIPFKQTRMGLTQWITQLCPAAPATLCVREDSRKINRTKLEINKQGDCLFIYLFYLEVDYLFICKAKPEASTALKPLQTEPLLKENKLGMFQQLPTEINSAGPKQRANIEQSPKSVKSKVTNERPSRYPLHIPRVARATPRPGGLFTFPGKSIIPLTFPANTNKETPLCCRVFGRAEPRLAQLGGGMDHPWITLGFTLGTGQG